MKKLTVEQALQKINTGQIEPLYYLTGKEKFFHDQIIEALTNKIFTDKGSRDLNLTVLYGTENTLGELLSAVLSYPMLAEYKLVIVRDFDQMKINDSESLDKYLKNLQKTTCLVLSAADKGRKKIYNAIEQAAYNIDCKPIPDYKAGGWFANYCRQNNINIDQQAIILLINQVGSNLLTLNLELKKLRDFNNDNSNITVEDIEQTTGISKDFSVFALQNALAQRQIAASLKTGNNLLDSGQNINLIVAVLYAFFRKILIASSLKSRGKGRQQIAQEMGLNEFQFKDIYNALNKFNPGQINNVINILHQADINAKTSAIEEKPGLQMLCYKICRI
ncbi:MAG: DNA polymerase III subunit delta [Calditrichaceae bacterium]